MSKQVVWATSILIAAPIALHQRWLTIPTAHVEVLAGAAAIGSVFAELFMIKSLLVFDPKVPVDGNSAPTSPRYRTSRVISMIRCFTTPIGHNIIIIMRDYHDASFWV